MFKHWRALVGGLFFIQPAWEFIKWVLDWAGRIDLITSHLHDFGVQAMLDFISHPPAWTFLPSVGAGLLLIWWDVKRKEVAEIELNKKLLIGFYVGCAAVTIGIWGTALPLYTPKRPPVPPPPSKSVEAPKPVLPPLPPPKPPWLSPEEIALQQNKSRPLLIYSPQEIFAMLAEGQNINVFGDRWVKIAGATSSLPTPEKIQNKDYYRIEFKLDSVRSDYGRVATYFDPKKYGDMLMNTRPGSQLKAVCQLTKVESKQPYPNNSFYSTITEYTFIYYNCEPL